MGNPMCELPYGAYNKKVAGTTTHRPHTSPNPATVGTLKVGHLLNIDPSKTPVSAYIKKTK